MIRRDLAFSIDFEPYVEAMEESFPIAAEAPRFDVEDELTANLERCLELLARHGVRGTFFVLGWIAERFPRLVREIAAAGHEIGSHSFHHRRLWALPEAEAREAIRRSKTALEDAAGVPVVGFRAPDFSLRPDSPLLAYLAESGFAYDASLNPTTLHDVYATGGGRRGVHRLSGLLEFPPASVALPGGATLTVGGGGYFRLFPGWLTRRWLRRSADPNCYLHPYEIGGRFPRGLSMSLARRWRHHYGNGRLDGKLAALFAAFRALFFRDYLRLHYGLA